MKQILKCKRVGIDLDNTITELMPTLVDMAKYYGEEVPSVDQIKDFNLSSVFGVSEQESKIYWQEREWFLIKNAEVSESRLSSILESFADHDTEIHFITNRPPRFYFETKKWLERNSIKHKSLQVFQGSKLNAIRDLDLDVMVDDKPDLFYEIQNKKNNHERIRTRMVCVDYPYNKYAPCDYRMSRDGKIKTSESWID